MCSKQFLLLVVCLSSILLLICPSIHSTETQDFTIFTSSQDNSIYSSTTTRTRTTTFEHSIFEKRDINNFMSIIAMQNKFYTSVAQLTVNCVMKNTSNSVGVCSENDPCKTFDQLFESMKQLMNQIIPSITSRNVTYNIMFLINIKSDLLLENYGNLELPSHPLISYFFIFQSENKNILTFNSDSNSEWFFNRNDFSWIIFNNLEIVNYQFLSNEVNVDFGYVNCILKSTQIQSMFNGDYLEMSTIVNVLFESCEIMDSYIAIASTFLTLFKDCTFGNSNAFTQLIMKNSNQVVFESINAQNELLFISIDDTNIVIFKKGKMTYCSLSISTINVKKIHISYMDVINCSKDYLVFTVLFSDSCTIVNSLFKKTGSILNIRGVKKLSIGNVIFDENIPTMALSNALSSSLSLRVIDNMLLENVTVRNQYSDKSNDDQALFIDDITNFSINNCNFENNRIIALKIHNPITVESFKYGYIINNTRFYNNKCTTNGCALNLEVLFNLKMSKCHFENNESKNYGGAIFGTALQGSEISDCIFVNNSAEISGGALFFGGLVLRPIDISNSIFIRNYAKKAGAIYFESRSVQSINNTKFIENRASEFAGAIYSTTPLSKSFVETCLFTNNRADIFGNDFMTLPKKVIPNSILGMTYIKPGNTISVNMTAYSIDNEIYPLDSMPQQVFPSQYLGKNLYLKTVVESFVVHYTPYIVNDPNLILIEEELSVSIIVANTTAVAIMVTNCSEGEILKPVAIANVASIYACEKISVLSIRMFLGILIPVTIIVFTLGIIVTICVMKGLVHIRKRLVLLREKENAEKSVEKRIIDKKLIFGDSYEPLIDETTTTTTNHSNHSNDQMNNNIYGQEMKVRSFIIPISELYIERKLAEGGQGVVYVGNWNKSTVAIKSLKDDKNDGFETEVSLLASLRHPCILTLYGISITNDSKYMITEYLAGGSLEKLIYSSKMKLIKLNLKEKINMLKDIVIGMNYLHSLTPPIIHRDLKPANVLLDNNNRCKIADFGLSLSLSPSNTTMTKNIGTFQYMAPEIISSNITHSQVERSQRAPKVDVYSFAIIMWELFFEVSPFAQSEKVNYLLENSIGDIIGRVLRGERPNIPFSNEIELNEWLLLYPVDSQPVLSREVMVKIVMEYCEIVKKCWNATPMERPSFAQIIQLLNDLGNNFK